MTFISNIAIAFGLALLSLGYVLPGHSAPWVSFQQQVAAALGCFFLGLGACVSRPRGEFRVSVLAGGAVALSLVPLLQFSFGLITFSSDAVLAFLYVGAFGLCVMVGASLSKARGVRWLHELFGVFVVAGTASALIALMQWLEVRGGIWVIDLPLGERPYGNLAQPNHLATLLALGLIGVLHLFEHRKLRGAAAGLLAALMGAALVMTQSRTGWVFCVLLIVWRIWPGRRIAMRTRLSVFALAAAIFSVCVVTWPALNDALLLSRGASSIAERATSSTRLAHWALLCDAAWRAPWFGYGWQQVSIAQQAALLDHPPVQEALTNSHNIVLDLVLWMGLPLGLLVAAGVAVWLVRQIRACQCIDHWALLAAIGAILLHAMLEFPLDYAYFLLPLALLMGSLERWPAETRRKNFELPKTAMALSLSAMLGMLGWITVEYLQIEEETTQLRFALARIGTDVTPRLTATNVHLLVLPREFDRFWTVQAKKGMSADQLDWMRDLVQRNPMPGALVKYALATGLNGREEESARARETICHLYSKRICVSSQQMWATAQEQYPELRNKTRAP